MPNRRIRNKVEGACFFAFSARMESLSAQQLSLRWRGKENYLSLDASFVLYCTQ